MTKKTTAKKTTQSPKASPAKASKADVSAKAAKPRGRPRKLSTPEAKEKKSKQSPKVTQSKQATKKVKAAGADTSKPARRGRKPKADSEVEIKVREIVKKTQSKTSGLEEKKETSLFSLDDVRAILKKRKAEKTPSKTKKGEKKEKSVPSKAAPKKATKSAKVKKIQTASIDDILGFGISTGPTRPIRDEANVPKEWNSYYNDLMSLRQSLKGALGQRSSETLGATARESSGELSINSSDSGTETFNRDVALSMVASEQEALEEIEDAIDRIFDGTFGICQETNKPIKKARLKVVPFTRFSLEGQTLYERRKRKDRDNGGGIFATISESKLGEDE
jgi:RNA polymerase-binding transcription factor DksA